MLLVCTHTQSSSQLHHSSLSQISGTTEGKGKTGTRALVSSFFPNSYFSCHEKLSFALCTHREKDNTDVCLLFLFVQNCVQFWWWCGFHPFQEAHFGFFSIHDHQPRRNAIFPAVCHIFSPNKLEIYYILYTCVVFHYFAFL